VIEIKVSVGVLSVKRQVTWPITVPKGMAVIIEMIITAVTQARLVVRRLTYVRPCSMYLISKVVPNECAVPTVENAYLHVGGPGLTI